MTYFTKRTRRIRSSSLIAFPRLSPHVITVARMGTHVDRSRPSSAVRADRAHLGAALLVRVLAHQRAKRGGGARPRQRAARAELARARDAGRQLLSQPA